MNRLHENPIIAAVKNDEELELALQTECQVIFLLYGSLLNIDTLVHRVQATQKAAVVHIDLIEGLNSKEIAADILWNLCRPDGIISTRTALIRRAKQLGMITVQRAFILDSLSLNNLSAMLSTGNPDFVEILPGIMPRIIAEICQQTEVPVIAGGLIRRKSEAIQALRSGAVAVSSTCPDMWRM